MIPKEIIEEIRYRLDIEEVIGLDGSEAPRVSAKTGENVEDVLEGIVL